MASRQIMVVRSPCAEERAGPASSMRDSGGLLHSTEGDVAAGKAVFQNTQASGPPRTLAGVGWRQSSVYASYNIRAPNGIDFILQGSLTTAPWMGLEQGGR